MLRKSLANVLVTILLVWCVPCARADWTRFHGPNGSGICADQAKMPVHWSSSANLKWKTKLPGPGVSSPIVVGDRVYVTCYSGYGLDRRSPGDQKNLKRHLVCIDRNSGKMVWNRIVEPVLPEDPYEGIGVPAHGYASSTPVSDGKNIYVFFGKTGALAFNQDGKQLWQTSVGTESDPRHWGSASSPILYKNLLIIPATAESEALVALDKQTGKEIWRQEATGFSNSWSTPVLARVNDTRSDLVIGVTQEIWGLNPDTGKLRWFSAAAKARSFCSSPASDHGVVYAIEGQTGVSIAVRCGGHGDVTKSHVLWTGHDSGRFGSPIARKGRIYSFANGVASVIDASTGKRVSRVRLKGSGEEHGGSDFASPIFADGKFYMVRRSGETFVLRGDDELETIAVNKVTDDTEEFSATPAASNGSLYIRSNKYLYCVADLGNDLPKTSVAKIDVLPDAHPSVEGSDKARGTRGDAAGGERRGGRRGRGGFDPAAMFGRLDANHDGKLSGDELPERMRGRMDQLDADKDDAITLKEFQSGMNRMFSGRRRGGSGGGGNAPAEKPDRPQRPKMEPAD